MKTNIMLLLIFSIFFFSCDKREDVYRSINIPPELEINTSTTVGSTITQFTNTPNITDSFNLVYNEYLISFRTTDEYKDASLTYIVDNNAAISLVSSTKIETGGLYTGTGVIKVVPTRLGIHTIDIMVTDLYSEVKKITINLNVYLRDNAPVVSISTVNNLNNNNPTYSTNNIIDTFSYSQGNIIIDYKIFDDNSNYTLNVSSTNGGIVNEDLTAKVITTLPNSVIVTGKLKLTPITLGQYIITIDVTDYVGQTTTIIAEIYIIDIPSQIFVNPGLNQFSSINTYANTFNEKFLFGQGDYQIKYKIIDDNPTPNFTFTSSNFGVLTDVIAQKTVSTVNGITTIEGVLLLQISFSGIHNIALKVQEFSVLNTSANVLDVRNNTPPTVTSAVLYSTVATPYYSPLKLIGTWNGSDVDATLFNDVVTYEINFEIAYSTSLFTASGLPVKPYTAYYLLNLPSTVSSGDQFRLKVRAHDSYGGVSAWFNSPVYIY